MVANLKFKFSYDMVNVSNQHNLYLKFTHCYMSIISKFKKFKT